MGVILSLCACVFPRLVFLFAIAVMTEAGELELREVRVVCCVQAAPAESDTLLAEHSVFWWCVRFQDLIFSRGGLKHHL